MIAFSYGRITRATVARNPVAKVVLLPLKLTGLGLFLFKLRLHVFKPFSFNTKSKGIQFRATSSFSSQECAIRRQGQRQAPSSAGMSGRHYLYDPPSQRDTRTVETVQWCGSPRRFRVARDASTYFPQHKLCSTP